MIRRAGSTVLDAARITDCSHLMVVWASIAMVRLSCVPLSWTFRSRQSMQFTSMLCSQSEW